MACERVQFSKKTQGDGAGIVRKLDAQSQAHFRLLARRPGNQKRFYSNPNDGKYFVARADEKLTAICELEAAIWGNWLDMLARFFAMQGTYENESSVFACYPPVHLHRAFTRSTSSSSSARWRLSRRQHGRRAKRPP